MPVLDERLARAFALIDAANSEDPRLDQDGDERVPRELIYSRRMSAMLERFAPEASEAVKLAVRAQHIRRWMVPRDRYSMDRAGYLKWRTGLYGFHADTVGRLLEEAGYDGATIVRVKAAVAKRALKSDPDAQMLEDVAALVFLESYLLEFAERNPGYSEEKWLDILRKTWRKMSDRARAFSLSGEVRLPEPLIPLIASAAHQSQSSQTR